MKIEDLIGKQFRYNFKLNRTLHDGVDNGIIYKIEDVNNKGVLIVWKEDIPKDYPFECYYSIKAVIENFKNKTFLLIKNEK